MADREADIYDIFVEAQQSPAPEGPRAEYLIRGRVERSLTERDPDVGGATYLKVHDAGASCYHWATGGKPIPRLPWMNWGGVVYKP